MSEAKVAPTITDPAPREPPKTQLPVPDGFAAAGAGREDGVSARRAVAAIVSFAAAAGGTVAGGVRWVALAVAALAVAAARFVGRSVGSGWAATRQWLRRSWDKWRNEVSAKRVAQDEEFLDRLSSTVEESKTEPPVSDRTKRR